jgi:enoyl-CoA hydratase/carnithine racemase
VNFINLHRDGPIARLSINQPNKRNALSRNMWRSIAAHVDEVARDESVRALTIESAVSGSFAAGADISEFEANYADVETTHEVNAEIHRAIDAVAACPQPTLAFINGPCVGGGVALVLACDIRLSSDKASYAVTPARLGLSYHPSDVRRLLSAVGRATASELLFSGATWSANRALQSGLVNTVICEAEFDKHCEDTLEAICANSVSAIRVLKQAIRYVESGDTALVSQADLDFTNLFSSADFLEARDAFLTKRPARFPSHSIFITKERDHP